MFPADYFTEIDAPIQDTSIVDEYDLIDLIIACPDRDVQGLLWKYVREFLSQWMSWKVHAIQDEFKWRLRNDVKEWLDHGLDIADYDYKQTSRRQQEFLNSCGSIPIVLPFYESRLHLKNHMMLRSNKFCMFHACILLKATYLSLVNRPCGSNAIDYWLNYGPDAHDAHERLYWFNHLCKELKLFPHVRYCVKLLDYGERYDDVIIRFLLATKEWDIEQLFSCPYDIGATDDDDDIFE